MDGVTTIRTNKKTKETLDEYRVFFLFHLGGQVFGRRYKLKLSVFAGLSENN